MHAMGKMSLDKSPVAPPAVYPEPGKHVVYDESQTIDPDNSPLRGGVLLKLLAFSSDPYLRERMRDPSVDVISFVVSATHFAFLRPRRILMTYPVSLHSNSTSRRTLTLLAAKPTC